MLRANGQTGTALYNVTEPVYYVAPDAISKDEITVQFWGRVHKSTSGGVGVVCEKGNVLVKKPSCKDAPQCEGSITPTKIELKELKAYEVNPNPCQQNRSRAGIFRPLGMQEKPVEEFDVQACFDRQIGRWRFNVPRISIKVVLDICLENLTGYNIVRNVSTLSKEEACFVLISMLLSDYEVYPVYIPFGGYVLCEILLAHEQEHKKDYYYALMNCLPEFHKRLEEILLECEEANNLNGAIKKTERRVDALTKRLLNDAYEEFRKNKRDDQTIQSGLKNLIEKIRWQLIFKCSGI